jgi:hypothetical protein
MATQASLFQIPDSTSPEANAAVVLNGGNGGGTPINVTIQDPGVDLARKTVCLKVGLSTMGNTRRVSTSEIEADADKNLLRA